MKRLMLLGFAAAALVLLSVPPAQAQVSETNQAIQVLTDYPGVGKRHTAFATPEDFTKTWGADVRNIDKAAELLQDALSKTSDPKAKAQLELARAYAKARLHKEARLSAQGALHYLCQEGGGGGEGCDKVPKYGSYVAP